MTVGQQRGWDCFWDKYGVDDSQSALFDFPVLFGNDNPVVFEIGFGMGQSLFEMAKSAPELNFLGVEVHRPGVGALLSMAGDAELENLKLMCCDANKVIDEFIGPSTLHRVQLFFPDPWHKKRHYKRRLVQPEFVERIGAKLADGGQFHMATDWEPYAEHMLDVMMSSESYSNLSKTSTYVEKPSYRPETKFERRGVKLGHGVWDLVFEKCS